MIPNIPINLSRRLSERLTLGLCLVYHKIVRNAPESFLDYYLKGDIMEVNRGLLLDTLFTLMRIMRNHSTGMSSGMMSEAKARAKRLRSVLGIGFAEARDLYNRRCD